MSLQPRGHEDGEEVRGEFFEAPATAIQRSWWFVHRMDPANAGYNVPLSFRLHGRINEDALHRSFDSLVERHEILRTTFGERDGKVVQVVWQELPPDWHCEHVSIEADLSAYSEKRAAEFAAELFDLEKSSLVRVRLERFDDRNALLVVVFHHIVVDLLSLRQCAAELKTLYSSFIRNDPAPLTEPEIQFADYASWLEKTHDVAATSRKLQLWKQRLQAFSGVLDVPVDFPRSAIQTGRGAQLRFRFDNELAAIARQFARSERLSLFIVMLSALKVLMHHYSGQRDVVIGTPFANRGDRQDLENVVGCFINTLPVPTDFTQIGNFRELLQSEKTSLLEILEIQDIPLESIVEAVGPRRDASYNPLFQVGFALQEPPQLSFEGVELENLHTHSGGSMFDLHFWLWETSGGIEGTIWYNPDLHREDTVRRMAGHYQSLLSQLLDNPHRSIGSLQLLTPAEEQQLRMWNATDREWPAVSSVVEMVLAQCERTPDRIALSGPNQRYTYAELDTRSGQLARHLAARGVGRGDLVGVALEDDADLMTALLGILRTGAAYVPLDPGYPKERVRYMLEQAGIRVLVTQNSVASEIPELPLELVLLDAHASLIESAPVISFPELDPEMRMYVIYTSGSTGEPKAVQITHRNAINALYSMAERPGVREDDRLLTAASVAFDMAVLMYLPLIVGGTTVLAAREVLRDGAALRSVVEKERVSVLVATPSTWRLILNGSRRSERLVGIVAGEPFPSDLAEQMLTEGVEVWNGYGPTEATVSTTFFRVTDSRLPIYIGSPNANTQCHVLNEYFSPMPIGIAGELYIGGEGVGQGYLNDPVLTAARFLDNPFGKGRLYRSGDFVRRASDGNLEYLYRTDHQVKVRGFRIELEEIEAMIVRHDAVAEAAVLAREYGHADTRLVAYVRFARGNRLTITDLRGFLRELLPDYMIPQLLVEIQAMPITPAGKIDRSALPNPLHRESQSVAASASSETERRLASIWSRILQVPDISAASNFFDVGGHSLLAIEVLFEMEREFGVRLTPRDLMMNTLGQIAAGLSSGTARVSDEDPDMSRTRRFALRLRSKLGL